MKRETFLPFNIKLLCCHLCFFIALVHFMNSSLTSVSSRCLSTLALACFPKMLTLSHYEHFLLYTGNLLGMCEFPQYLQFIDFALSNVLFFCSHFYTTKLYCFLTLLSQATTCLLVISLVFTTLVYFHIISVMISSLLMLLKIAF